jgi:hypothetical protein
MGASGNLSIIPLEKYKWEDIKNEILNEILESCPNYSDSNNECEEYYFKVAKMQSFDDFIWTFSNKIVDYCPDENGIYINGKFYDSWAGENMPQIIENNLVLYDTDQQMSYQNIPTECLRKLISYSKEIWT